jgi:pimeloyl-ACP methyl ester carboxylesterase
VAAVREAITDVQVTIREGTGHSIPIEDGNFVAQEIAAFLR